MTVKVTSDFPEDQQKAEMIEEYLNSPEMIKKIELCMKDPIVRDLYERGVSEIISNGDVSGETNRKYCAAVLRFLEDVPSDNKD